jgi:adenylate cyclase
MGLLESAAASGERIRLRRLGRAGVALGVALASAGSSWALSNLWVSGKLAREVEETTLDWRVRSVPRRDPATAPVVLVLFDSAAVEQWPYLSPYPRAALADVINAVSSVGPRAIGVDVYLDRRYPELDRMDQGDSRLREAIRNAGNVVLATGTSGTERSRRVFPVDTFFGNVAAGVGTADLPTPFETVRDVVLTAQADGKLVPGLALALYARSRGMNPDTLLARARREGRLPVPGLPDDYARLGGRSGVRTAPLLFLGPPSRAEAEETTFPTFSASTIAALGPMVPAEWFRGKTVLIGSGFHDSERFRSPFYDYAAGGQLAGWTYGVEVHATALENLLAGRFPRPLPRPLRLALVLALAAAVTGVVFRRGVAWGAGVAVLLFVGHVAAAFAAFGYTQVAVPVVAPTLALALAFIGATSYVSVVEGREKREIRSAFAQYVSPEVVAELVADPSKLRLGGEKRPITVMFCDLEGFTALAERTEPQRLVALLNRYLDEMTQVVHEERGTVDKYIGDAVMAFWGAPVSVQDHALRSCRAALKMQRRLSELNDEWRREGWSQLNMRIGINSGHPIVGNIGGRGKFDYTALGDAVNLAARLEPACKGYGVGILISDETRQAAGRAIVAREIELLAVYGREEPIAVWELVALADDELGSRAQMMEHFARGVSAFRSRDWEMARVFFGQALAMDPHDGPSLLYLERTERCIAEPPAEDWSYVERRQVK